VDVLQNSRVAAVHARNCDCASVISYIRKASFNILLIIIHANDVVRRRGYCDHFVMMCVYVWGVYVSMMK